MVPYGDDDTVVAEFSPRGSEVESVRRLTNGFVSPRPKIDFTVMNVEAVSLPKELEPVVWPVRQRLEPQGYT